MEQWEERVDPMKMGFFFDEGLKSEVAIVVFDSNKAMAVTWKMATIYTIMAGGGGL